MKRLLLVMLSLAAVFLNASPLEHPLPVISRFFSLPVGTVIIDPGHGGTDPGARGIHIGEDGTLHTIFEKDLNLALALDLEAELAKRFPDLRIVLTRREDLYLTLARRAALAHEAPVEQGKSKIFVSLHANAAASTEARGFEVWVDQQKRHTQFVSPVIDDAAVRALTASLNRAMASELREATLTLAETLVEYLDASVGEHTPNRGVRKSDFYVLTQTVMPAVIIETGFMTNVDELRQLTDEAYQKRIVTALADALEGFIEAE